MLVPLLLVAVLTFLALSRQQPLDDVPVPVIKDWRSYILQEHGLVMAYFGKQDEESQAFVDTTWRDFLQAATRAKLNISIISVDCSPESDQSPWSEQTRYQNEHPIVRWYQAGQLLPGFQYVDQATQNINVSAWMEIATLLASRNDMPSFAEAKNRTVFHDLRQHHSHILAWSTRANNGSGFLDVIRFARQVHEEVEWPLVVAFRASGHDTSVVWYDKGEPTGALVEGCFNDEYDWAHDTLYRYKDGSGITASRVTTFIRNQLAQTNQVLLNNSTTITSVKTAKRHKYAMVQFYYSDPDDLCVEREGYDLAMRLHWEAFANLVREDHELRDRDILVARFDCSEDLWLCSLLNPSDLRIRAYRNGKRVKETEKLLGYCRTPGDFLAYTRKLVGIDQFSTVPEFHLVWELHRATDTQQHVAALFYKQSDSTLLQKWGRFADAVKQSNMPIYVVQLHDSFGSLDIDSELGIFDSPHPRLLWYQYGDRVFPDYTPAAINDQRVDSMNFTVEAWLELASERIANERVHGNSTRLRSFADFWANSRNQTFMFNLVYSWQDPNYLEISEEWEVFAGKLKAKQLPLLVTKYDCGIESPSQWNIRKTPDMRLLRGGELHAIYDDTMEKVANSSARLSDKLLDFAVRHTAGAHRRRNQQGGRKKQQQQRWRAR